MRRKQDKIDGLFRDYFAGNAGAELVVRDDSSPRYACGSTAFRESGGPLPPKAKCPAATKLGAYIDGSLAKNGADLIETHIMSCKQCREKVSQAKAAIEQFEKGALPEASERVSVEALSRLTKRTSRKKQL